MGVNSKCHRVGENSKPWPMGVHSKLPNEGEIEVLLKGGEIENVRGGNVGKLGGGEFEMSPNEGES
jgi:hypothetical protein